VRKARALDSVRDRCELTAKELGGAFVRRRAARDGGIRAGGEAAGAHRAAQCAHPGRAARQQVGAANLDGRVAAGRGRVGSGAAAVHDASPLQLSSGGGDDCGGEPAGRRPV
jgi:hypothetical protein